LFRRRKQEVVRVDPYAREGAYLGQTSSIFQTANLKKQAASTSSLAIDFLRMCLLPASVAFMVSTVQRLWITALGRTHRPAQPIGHEEQSAKNDFADVGLSNDTAEQKHALHASSPFWSWTERATWPVRPRTMTRVTANTHLYFKSFTTRTVQRPGFVHDGADVRW
jgi:hypothetical protein